jgi:hypothetical protein
MFSAAGLSLCFILAAILLSTGTKPAAYGATAMVFIFQIFLGIGYLPIVCFFVLSILPSFQLNDNVALAVSRRGAS